MNKEQLWEAIHFQIEHQIYDLMTGDESEEDNEVARASLAVDNIKSLLKENGFEIIKVN